MIAAWAGWEFRADRRFSLRVFAACGAAILLGLGINTLLLLTLGVPDAAFGNFAWTLYGLVHGGDWRLALAQHPELATLPPGQQTRAMYDLALGRIHEQPASLLVGCLRA
jgi:hypothetical protein